MIDPILSPERCAAIRARLAEGTYGYYFDIVGWREANDDVRDLLAAYDQITLERDKGERVFQAVVYAFEGKDVPEDLLTHGMVSRAMKHREAAEAALVVLTQREQHVKALIAEWRDDAKEYGSAHFAICANDLEQALAGDGGTHQTTE